MTEESTKNKYNWLVTFLLCLFLGVFGAHRFYAKKNISAVLQLFLTLTIFGTLISIPWAIFDLIVILANKFNAKDGTNIYESGKINLIFRYLVGTSLFTVFLILFFYQQPPMTQAEILKINAQKKTDFLNFERQLYSTTKECDAGYNKAIKSLTKSGFGDSAINFQDVQYSCLDAFNGVQKIKAPTSLSDNQVKQLKSAIDDLTIAYASKRGASSSAYKYFETGDASKMNKAKEEIELSQENLLKGMLKVEQVKKELNIK